MHFSSTFILTALPFIAAALTTRQGPAPIVYHMTANTSSSDTDINGQPIIARNQSFYISQGSGSSLCGTSDDNLTKCDRPTNLFIEAASATLSVQVYNGQRIYLAATGALSYLPAHANSAPPGARAIPLYVGDANDPDSPSPAKTNLLFGDKNVYRYFTSSQWLACPVQGSTSSYQIFANVTGLQAQGTNCQDIVIDLGRVAANTTEDMPWQFT